MSHRVSGPGGRCLNRFAAVAAVALSVALLAGVALLLGVLAGRIPWLTCFAMLQSIARLALIVAAVPLLAWSLLSNRAPVEPVDKAC